MSSSNLANVFSHRLNIQREETQLEAMLVIAFDSGIGALNQTAAELLGPIEAAYYSNLRFERRQKSYLLGRYAAKLALREVLLEPDFRSIQILKGVFEQPIVHSERESGWAVTISHAGSLAAGLAYPAGHPMGVDVERIDEARRETILSQLSPQEIEWVERTSTGQNDITTAIWTAKESLSKVLKTGLMTPVQIYSLAEFNQINPGIWEGQFLNFAQYKARVWVGSSYVLSIAMPKRSMIGELSDLCATL